MNEQQEEDDNQPSFEELRRRKDELENEIPDLLVILEKRQNLKEKLLEAQKDNKKLIHHREKLKVLKSKHLGSSLNAQSKEKKAGEESHINGGEGLLLDTTGKQDNEEDNAIIASLKREIHALKIENSSLVREKRKVEEQKDDLVQELAALNTKHGKLLAVCNRLEEEIHRLSSCVGKSQSEASDQKEDIEILKEQLRFYQDDIKSFQAELQSSQRNTEHLKVELSEARSVIRDIRRQPPSVQVYPAAIYEPVYRNPDDYGYRHTREPLGYTMTRSYSGECLVPLRGENRRSRVSYKKSFLTPDLTAEVDNEVVDRSLASPKSI